MKLEKIVKETGRFGLTVVLTTSVITGALIGIRYANAYYKSKAQEEIRICIEEERNYVPGLRDIDFFIRRIKEQCLKY